MNLERKNVEIDVEFERRERIICNNCFIPLKNAALPKSPIVCISFPLVSDIIVRIYFSSESVTRYFFFLFLLCDVEMAFDDFFSGLCLCLSFLIKSLSSKIDSFMTDPGNGLLTGPLSSRISYYNLLYMRLKDYISPYVKL